jgi:hypothetical protein
MTNPVSNPGNALQGEGLDASVLAHAMTEATFHACQKPNKLEKYDDGVANALLFLKRVRSQG